MWNNSPSVSLCHCEWSEAIYFSVIPAEACPTSWSFGRAGIQNLQYPKYYLFREYRRLLILLGKFGLFHHCERPGPLAASEAWREAILFLLFVAFAYICRFVLCCATRIHLSTPPFFTKYKVSVYLKLFIIKINPAPFGVHVLCC